MTKRYIIVGDVHGCIDEAKQLLGKVKYNRDEDTLISLGDLVDRGPDSAGCVELFYTNGAKLVQANHENKLLRWKRKQSLIDSGVRRKQNDVRLKSHHKESIHSLDSHPKSKELWKYLESAYLFYGFKAGGTLYDCIHAGYLPFKGRKTDPKLIIRLRHLEQDWETPLMYDGDDSPKNAIYWAEAWQGPQTVIFGHNVFTDIKEFPYAIGLDTGCVFGGKLTALVIDAQTGNKDYVSVKAVARHYGGYEGVF